MEQNARDGEVTEFNGLSLRTELGGHVLVEHSI